MLIPKIFHPAERKEKKETRGGEPLKRVKSGRSIKRGQAPSEGSAALSLSSLVAVVAERWKRARIVTCFFFYWWRCVSDFHPQSASTLALVS